MNQINTNIDPMNSRRAYEMYLQLADMGYATVDGRALMSCEEVVNNILSRMQTAEYMAESAKLLLKQVDEKLTAIEVAAAERQENDATIIANLTIVNEALITLNQNKNKIIEELQSEINSLEDIADERQDRIAEAVDLLENI